MNDKQARKIRNTDLESGSRDGGRKSTNTTTKEQRWDTIFTISCAIAIFIDPLYCYAPVIRGNCLELHQRLMWTYIGLRLAVDVFYAIDLGTLWWSFRTRSNQKTVPSSEEEKKGPVISFCKKTFGTFCTRNSQTTRVLYLILVSLPLPEGLLLSSIICSKKLLYTWDPTYALIITTPIQYSLRIYHMYVSLRPRRPILKSLMGNWLLKAVMDYIPFVLASHLFGALWYRLAVQRQVDCWKLYCNELLLDTECKSISSRQFFCDKMSSSKISNLSTWDKLCHPVKEANPEVFDFGIYFHALQSNVTSSTHAVQRISQSFWWALRNLSSFGSNLQTSLYTMEIFLSVLISISGMALFLVYLNARVQESQKILREYKSKPLPSDQSRPLEEHCI